MPIKEVKGTLVDFYVRDQGTSQWKQIVCTEDSTFTISAAVTKKRTNCGPRTYVADIEHSAAGNAVQNASPTSAQASYAYIKARMRNKTIQEFKYVSTADADEGLAEAEGIYNYGDGYFTELGAAASAEADGVLTYAWSFEGTGYLDTNESP